MNLFLRALKSKLYTAVTFCFLISFHFLSAQTTLTANALLQDVDIFKRGATLHHKTKKIAIPKGNSGLLVVQISKQVNENSIRINTSNPNVSIQSISFEKNYINETEGGSPQYKELKEKLDAEKNKLDTMISKRKGEEGVLALLEENRKLGGSTGVSPDKISNMIAYYREQYINIAAHIEALRKSEDQQADRVQKLQKQLDQLGESTQETGQLFIKLHATQATHADFDIYYFTNQVSWNPFYEIQVNSLNQPLILAYKANVSQQTGIDWQQVHLKFSSGNPNQNNNVPVLTPWRLSFLDHGVRSLSARSAPKMMLNTAKLADKAEAEEEVFVEENQLNNSFVVADPYDVFSGGQAQAVELKEYQLPTEYTYFTAPKLDETAFLIGKITDWEQYNLLPGNANLLIDNNYAGTSYINPNSTEDTLTLSLGRDDRIYTKYEKVEEEGSKTTFLGKTKKRGYSYEITVKNTRNETTEMEVVEQFPLSTEKDIVVKLINTSGAEVNNEKGELHWKISLEPGEAKVLKISYSISFPKDKHVSGI